MIGLMKDKLGGKIIKQFVTLRLKLNCCLTDDGWISQIMAVMKTKAMTQKTVLENEKSNSRTRKSASNVS